MRGMHICTAFLDMAPLTWHAPCGPMWPSIMGQHGKSWPYGEQCRPSHHSRDSLLQLASAADLKPPCGLHQCCMNALTAASGTAVLLGPEPGLIRLTLLLHWGMLTLSCYHTIFENDDKSLCVYIHSKNIYIYKSMLFSALRWHLCVVAWCHHSTRACSHQSYGVVATPH